MSNETFCFDVVSVRLRREYSILSEEPITCSEDAVRVVQQRLCDADREIMCVILLTSKLIPICMEYASIGKLDSAIAHPRELLKSAILANAYAMILVHNHLGSDLTPSRHDIAVTDRMLQLCKLVGIELYDHIIVGSCDAYLSMREADVIAFDEKYQDRGISLQQLDFGPDVAQKVSEIDK